MNALLRYSKALLTTGALATLSALPAHADRLERIASPVSNPVNFEDPRIESNLKPIFVYHKLDEKFVTGGGDVRIYALQARFAVNDSLAIIATKDGIVDFNPDQALNDEVGLANLAGGVKYALYQDAAKGQIATVGLRYEAPTGAKRVFQGEGKGAINPFFSGALSLGSEEMPINIVAGTGLRIPFSSKDSTFFDADLHVDTSFGWFSPMFELNLVNVLDAGNRLGIADEGQDFFNFGASLSEDKTMLTGAAGARVRLSDSLSWGTAYQFPIAQGSGTYVTDWRLTTDLTYTF